jgi:hypothetical protein
LPKIPKSQKSAFLGRKHVRFWQIDTQTEFFGQTKPSFTFLGKLEKVGGQILKIEKSKIQGKTREKVKKVRNFQIFGRVDFGPIFMVRPP